MFFRCHSYLTTEIKSFSGFQLNQVVVGAFTLGIYSVSIPVMSLDFDGPWCGIDVGAQGFYIFIIFFLVPKPYNNLFTNIFHRNYFFKVIFSKFITKKFQINTKKQLNS